MFHTLRKDPSLTGLAGGGSFLWQVFRREISEKREDAGQPLLRFPACIMKKFILALVVYVVRKQRICAISGWF